MSEPITENVTPEDSSTGGPQQVPVAEAIKYRRRAQQAESQLQQSEQQLEDMQSQIQQRVDELAQAEAQRDEAQSQLAVVENRMSAERLLNAAGVIDLETASVLLAKRIDLQDGIDAETLADNVQQLLLDKPFLRDNRTAALPSKTASARMPQASSAEQLAQAAQRAASSGDRRDVAEYLRLRRRSSMVG